MTIGLSSSGYSSEWRKLKEKDRKEQVQVEREKRVKEGAPMHMTVEMTDDKTQDLSQ